MEKAIYFDMDGTIADLYGVDGWLDDLMNESTRPYAAAAPLLNMQQLARRLNILAARGFSINIISWTARGGSAEYNERVKEVKIQWLHVHLRSVHFDNIYVVPYGTPKENFGNGILFDDEPHNRETWQGVAHDVNNILEILKGL